MKAQLTRHYIMYATTHDHYVLNQENLLDISSLLKISPIQIEAIYKYLGKSESTNTCYITIDTYVNDMNSEVTYGSDKYKRRLVLLTRDDRAGVEAV